MRRRAHILVLAALTGSSGTTDSAGVHPNDRAAPAPAFAGADQDGDRVVSAQEWAADSALLFDRLDRNRDEAIDGDEWRASFEVLDLDADRAIERAEATDLVARGDVDGDGRVSAAEYEQVDRARLSADVNRDGRISRSEFFIAREQLFAVADRDGDRGLGRREIDPVRFPVFRF